MVHRTTQVNSAPGETPDVLEPISVDATTQIGTARNKCTELLELCDSLNAQLKAQIRNRVQAIRGALTALQTDVEEIMDIAEPIGNSAPNWPGVNQAMLDIEALGHEARIFVVDMTRYHEVYPFEWPPEPDEPF